MQVLISFKVLQQFWCDSWMFNPSEGDQDTTKLYYLTLLTPVTDSIVAYEDKQKLFIIFYLCWPNNNACVPAHASHFLLHTANAFC